MVDTGLNLAHDKKKYNQYTTEETNCPEGDATREKKKVGRGATKRRKQVQKMRMAPGVVIQQRKEKPYKRKSR